MNKDIIKYYHDRAQEYERIYAKPERQCDLQQATEMLQDIFKGKTVTEIACGTGYWTERLAKTAASIAAIDINEPVVEIARRKDYGNTVVCFEVADLYNDTDRQPADGLFGGFIWSHIPLAELDRFIDTINNMVVPGGTVVLMDSLYVEGSNHPISHMDEQGNTYQIRMLEDGTQHMVLKNFPTEEELKQRLGNKAKT